MINLKNANILVTGGTGFIGSHLIEALLKQKANVFTTYHTGNPRSYFFSRKLNKAATVVNADVCDFEKIFAITSRLEIDYIFHLAACTLVDAAYYNPKQTLNTNIMGTVHILESARRYSKIKGVIVASSDKAYGKILYSCHSDQSASWRSVEESHSLSASHRVKYLETDPLKGDHPYEVSKSATDLITQTYYHTYKLPVVITRFGNVYGEGDLNFSRIIPGIMKALIDNNILEIRSDGKYVRDYLYVNDVVDGCLLLLRNIDKVKGEAFNFGSQETLSVLQVIKLIEKFLDKKVKYKILNTAKNEISYQSLDFSKIQKKLGWAPKYTIGGTIRKIYNWYKSIL